MNPEPSPIRVVVSAAYPALRAGLRAMLDASPGLEVIGEFGVVTETAEVALAGADVLVADVAGGDSLEQLVALASETPAVFMASSPAVFRAMDGAPPRPTGLLLEGASADELVAAVHAVAAGLVVVDPAVQATLVHHHPVSVSGSSDIALTPLTAREQDVLALVAAGLPNKTIAMRLGISDHTVKFHVGAILGKLGAASRTEAVTTAVRAGMLPL